MMYARIYAMFCMMYARIYAMNVCVQPKQFLRLSVYVRMCECMYVYKCVCLHVRVDTSACVCFPRIRCLTSHTGFKHFSESVYT